MAYTPQTWHNSPATDTPISAARLAFIESGIALAHTLAEANAAGEQQSSLVVVRPAKGNITTYQAICREHGILVSSTDPDVPLQASIDHASNFESGTGHTGGRVLWAASRYNINTSILGRAVDTSNSPSVWPITIEGEGGLSAVNAQSQGGDGGTSIIWAPGSPPGSGVMFDMSADCHGYKIVNMCLDGNAVVREVAKSAGRIMEWNGVKFRHALSTSGAPVNGTSGKCLYVTNGNDASSDRYAGCRVISCRMEGSTGGYGLYVNNSGSGSGCTDGRVVDLGCGTCNQGSVYAGGGGWNFNGGHLTMSAPGTALGNFQSAAGFISVCGFYFDTNGTNPVLVVSNNNASFSGCFYIANGQTRIVDISAQNVVINGGTIGGGPIATNFLRSSSVNYLCMGISGDSTVITNLFESNLPKNAASDNLRVP